MFDTVVAMVICTTFFTKEAAIPAVLISIIQNLTDPVIVRYQKNREVIHHANTFISSP
jgi:predicted Na+-dependent transporter